MPHSLLLCVKVSLLVSLSLTLSLSTFFISLLHTHKDSLSRYPLRSSSLHPLPLFLSLPSLSLSLSLSLTLSPLSFSLPLSLSFPHTHSSSLYSLLFNPLNPLTLSLVSYSFLLTLFLYSPTFSLSYSFLQAAK